MMSDFFCKVSEVKNTNTAAAIKKKQCIQRVKKKKSNVTVFIQILDFFTIILTYLFLQNNFLRATGNPIPSRTRNHVKYRQKAHRHVNTHRHVDMQRTCDILSLSGATGLIT